MFSVGGKFYNGRPLVYTYMPDTVLENARNVSINLHGRFGRFVKVQLYFSTRWIMISEVVFESGKIADHYIYISHVSRNVYVQNS
jgi:discoidin domain receptor family protein 2